MIKQPIYANAPGSDVGAYILHLANNDGNRHLAYEAAVRDPSRPAVAAVLKAEVTPLTTVGGGLPFMYYGLGAEATAAINAVSILGRLAPYMRRVGFYTKSAIETSGNIVAGWVGENAAIPAAALKLETGTLTGDKTSIIVAVDKETLRFGQPNAEADIRRLVFAAVADFQDTQFLTPSVNKSATVNPASITSSIAGYVSTGTSDAQFEADCEGMLARLGRWEAPHWIARPKLAMHLARKLGVVNLPGPNVLGFPIIASVNSPAQLTLVDAADILYAEGNVEILVSPNAALIMTDDAGSSPVTASLVSGFQRNIVAIRVLREMNWLLCHSTSCVWMSVNY